MVAFRRYLASDNFRMQTRTTRPAHAFVSASVAPSLRSSFNASNIQDPLTGNILSQSLLPDSKLANDAHFRAGLGYRMASAASNSSVENLNSIIGSDSQAGTSISDNRQPFVALEPSNELLVSSNPISSLSPTTLRQKTQVITGELH